MFWMDTDDKDLVWLHGQVKTPPFTREARLEVGFLLRHLQQGGSLLMPKSLPMPNIGANGHELRLQYDNKTWSIFYTVHQHSIVRSESFVKSNQ